MFFVSEQAIDTQEMLESISQSFITSTNLIIENWWIWLLFLVFLVVMVVLLVMVKKKSPVAYFITRNSAFARKLIENTYEQKTVLDVQVEYGDESIVIAMTVEQVYEREFLVRSTKESVIQDSAVLKDTKVRCSLLSTIKGEQGYYMLCAKVVEGSIVDTFLELTLRLPDNVEKIQRREHLRIEPKDEYILGIALWSEKVVNGEFVNTPELWGEPEYKYIPGKISQVRLMNISASGAKMLIGVDSAHPKLTLDKKCIMLIDIWEPELQQKVRYWIRCVEQNMFKIKDKNAVEVGVRFREWTTAPLHDSSLHFVLISKYGEIPPLANWIMKRYLEQYKEHPVTSSALAT